MREKELWAALFRLGRVMQIKPATSLYGLLTDGDEDLELIKAYVAAGHSANYQYAGGHTAKLAVSNCRLETVRYIVDQCEDLRDIDVLDAAASRIADSTGEQLEEARTIIDFLLSRFPDQDSLRTAYSTCAAFGQLSAAEEVLKRGLTDADIQCGHNQFQPYSEWLEERGFDSFAALLKGQDIDRTQLERNELKQRRRGAKLRDLRREIMPFAAIEQLAGNAFDEAHQLLVQELTQGSWDEGLLSRDPHFQRSVLEFFAENNFTDLISEVLDRGVLNEKRRAEDGYAAAIAAATHGHLVSIKLLAAAGVTVTATPEDSNSPLSESTRAGHLQVVEYLLSNGADAKSSDGSGHQFPLVDLAGGPNRKAIVDLLQQQA